MSCKFQRPVNAGRRGDAQGQRREVLCGGRPSDPQGLPVGVVILAATAFSRHRRLTFSTRDGYFAPPLERRVLLSSIARQVHTAFAGFCIGRRLWTKRRGSNYGLSHSKRGRPAAGIAGGNGYGCSNCGSLDRSKFMGSPSGFRFSQGKFSCPRPRSGDSGRVSNFVP